GAGAVRLELGTVDVSGAHTALAPVLAAALGMPAEAVTVVPCDTATSPDSEISGASRTTFATGAAGPGAARHLLARLGAAPGAGLGALVRRSGQASVRGRAEVALDGRPVAVAHLVRVAVDAATGATRALRCVAAQDAGFVVEPALAAGQVEGGVCQG